MGIETEGGAFNVEPGKDMWTGGNVMVGMTVIGSEKNTNPSSRLNGEPSLCFVSNSMKPFVPGSPQEQVLIGELNGVFLHVKVMQGRVYVVMADHRLN